jgi:hypothetical protein
MACVVAEQLSGQGLTPASHGAPLELLASWLPLLPLPLAVRSRPLVAEHDAPSAAAKSATNNPKKARVNLRILLFPPPPFA